MNCPWQLEGCKYHRPTFPLSSGWSPPIHNYYISILLIAKLTTLSFLYSKWFKSNFLLQSFLLLPPSHLLLRFLFQPQATLLHQIRKEVHQSRAIILFKLPPSQFLYGMVNDVLSDHIVLQVFPQRHHRQEKAPYLEPRLFLCHFVRTRFPNHWNRVNPTWRRKKR